MPFMRPLFLNLPALLAFALLALQVAIPWSARYFVTQDGPSHLYAAAIARDLLRDGSVYAPIYTFHPEMVSNWGTMLLFNAASMLFGVANAERVIATICILLGFFGIAYLLRSLDPAVSPWTPVINFLITTWFLWIGFYNFYIGMALCPFIIGFYIRHARALTARRAAIIAVALVLLFFTHVLPVGLGVMAISVACVWLNVLSPLIISPEPRPPARETLRQSWKPLLAAFCAVAPALALVGLFMRNWNPAMAYDPSLEWAWVSFPMHVFAAARGRVGEQFFLYPAMMFFMGVGALAMRRTDWASAKGALAVVTVLTFLLYLFMPNAGFGAEEIKIRLAWGFFVFGCTLAYSVTRMQAVRTPVSIYVASFLIFTLLQAAYENVRTVSRAVAVYADAMKVLPPGAKFVRMRYPNETTRNRFGFGELALEPMLHVDSLVAAERGLIALTDYQPISHAFPVIVSPRVPMHKQYQLWELENEKSTNAAATLQTLLSDFPVPIDYVMIVGDGTPGREKDLKDMLAKLDASMRLISTDQSGSWIRIYQRIPAAAARSY
jgi:hypothetical protein